MGPRRELSVVRTSLNALWSLSMPRVKSRPKRRSQQDQSSGMPAAADDRC